MSNKVVKKFFNLVENSKEFYKDFLLRDPKNIYIPEIYLSIKELIYINEKCNEFANITLPYKLSPTEYSFLYYIGLKDTLNVTFLSKITKSSKGYTSKVVKKLIEEGYVNSSQTASNKKEIYLSLSKTGSNIYIDIYKHLIKERNEFDMFLLENFTDDELKNILDFFTKINKFKNEKYLDLSNKNK